MAKHQNSIVTVQSKVSKTLIFLFNLQLSENNFQNMEPAFFIFCVQLSQGAAEKSAHANEPHE
jgi:hypothetical protein